MGGRVAYFWDDDLGAFAYSLQHPMKPHRIKMAHNLVVNYGLDKHMEILRPTRATAHQMTAFHTDEFVDFLKNVTPETADELTGNGQKFLIGEDCPAFEGVWDFCTISAGGSMACAQRINSGDADIAINWAGGLHHAKKREASGFCYINDIVLAIIELLRYHARVLYIDIDIHHGDGVEEAFYSTDRVMTCSLHKFGDYFPGTGDLKDRGIGKGKGYSVNVPLQDGIDDETYKGLFEPIVQHIIDWYRPGAIVLQCGADSLAEDKLGCFNLSMHGHADCVRFVKKFGLPMIILGGGGYTIRNVARTWAYETGIAVGQELATELPFNEYIEHFGPEFKLEVPPNNMSNLNTREICDHIRREVIEGLKSLPFAPGVAMRAVPPDPDADFMEDEPDMDVRITQRQRNAHVSRYGDVISDSEDNEGGYPSMYRRSLNGNANMPGDEMTGRGARRRRGRKAYDAIEVDNVGLPNGGDEAAPRKRTFFRSYAPTVEAIAPPQVLIRGHLSEDPSHAVRAGGGGILAGLARSDSPGPNGV